MRADGRMDRQTDRQTDVRKLIVAFRNFANAPKMALRFSRFNSVTSADEYHKHLLTSQWSSCRSQRILAVKCSSASLASHPSSSWRLKKKIHHYYPSSSWLVPRLLSSSVCSLSSTAMWWLPCFVIRMSRVRNMVISKINRQAVLVIPP
jgi:hypothetical protein